MPTTTTTTATATATKQLSSRPAVTTLSEDEEVPLSSSFLLLFVLWFAT